MAAGRFTGFFGRFLGRTVSEGAAFALGTALGPAMAPPLEELRQQVWALYPNRLIGVGQLAEGVVQGEITAAKAREWAKAHGYNAEQFAALRNITDNGPGIGRAYELWRRGLLDDSGFRKAVKREGIEDEWVTPLLGLKRELLTPAQLANAVVQGFRDLDTAAADAGRQGINRADFETMVNTTGLPPGPETLLEWRRRGIIDDAALDQGIREGHTKTKYIDEYHAALRRILSPAEYAGLALRGWITEQEMVDGGALSGMNAGDMHLLYLNRGRPATTRQIHIGWARGGRAPELGQSEEEVFRAAVRQSNIRTEYADLLWAQRFTYPSVFVVRALAQDGTFDPQLVESLLVESGWKPEWAKLVAEKWASAGGGGTEKWADRARSKLFTVTHDEYQDESIDETRAREMLDVVGVAPAEQDAILAVWKAEATINRLELTPAQVKKAYTKGKYTRQVALTELAERGMIPVDAETFLDT
jgi:hypothetical protein